MLTVMVRGAKNEYKEVTNIKDHDEIIEMLNVPNIVRNNPAFRSDCES